MGSDSFLLCWRYCSGPLTFWTDLLLTLLKLVRWYTTATTYSWMTVSWNSSDDCPALQVMIRRCCVCWWLAMILIKRSLCWWAAHVCMHMCVLVSAIYKSEKTARSYNTHTHTKEFWIMSTNTINVNFLISYVKCCLRGNTNGLLLWLSQSIFTSKSVLFRGSGIKWDFLYVLLFIFSRFVGESNKYSISRTPG